MATEKEIYISINGTKQAIKSLDDLTKATEELAKGFDDAGDAADDAAKKTEEAGKETGFLQDRYDDLKDTVKKLRADFSLATKGIKTFFTTGTRGAKALKIAFASTGIGLLVVAIASLIDYFKDTEEGSRALSVAFESVGVIINLIIDSIANLGGKLIEAFSNPVDTIKNFANTLKDFVIDRVKQIINGIGLLGTAIAKVFEGDFAGAADAAGEALNELFMVDEIAAATQAAGEAIVNTFETVTTAVTSSVSAVNNLVKAQRALRDLNQELIVENAELTKSLEENQKIAEDTTLAYDVRREALDNLNKANIQLAKNQAELAAAEESALRQELALASSYEDREELETQIAEAVASRIEAETALQNTRLDAQKLERELEQEELDRQANINSTLEQLRLENIQDEEQAALEALRIAEEATIRELELQRATQEQILEAQRLFEEQRTQTQEEFAEQRRKEAEEDAKKQIDITKQRNLDIANAEAALEQAKIDAVRGAISAIAQLAGDNEKLQNALFVVDQAVAAGEVILGNIKERAANAAYAATLGPAGPAYLAATNAATNIRTGISLATIAATTIGKLKGGKPSSPAGGGGGGGGGLAATGIPQFELDPARRAEALGQNAGETVTPDNTQSQTIRAYVVATEVTSQQEANQTIDNLARL